MVKLDYPHIITVAKEILITSIICVTIVEKYILILFVFVMIIIAIAIKIFVVDLFVVIVKNIYAATTDVVVNALDI
jgi:hypothetical protein